MSWGNRDAAVHRLVDARVALTRLEDAAGLQGVDEYHDAMRAVTRAAEALGVVVVNFDALARAQRRADDEGEA